MNIRHDCVIRRLPLVAGLLVWSSTLVAATKCGVDQRPEKKPAKKKPGK